MPREKPNQELPRLFPDGQRRGQRTDFGRLEAADGIQARLPMRWPKQETRKTAPFLVPSRPVNTKYLRIYPGERLRN